MTLATLKRRIDAIAARLTAPHDDITIVVQWLDGETWNGRGEAPMLHIAPGLLDKLEPDGDEPATPDAPATPDDKVSTPYVYRRERETRRPFPHELAERRQRPRWTVR